MFSVTKKDLVKNPPTKNKQNAAAIPAY